MALSLAIAIAACVFAPLAVATDPASGAKKRGRDWPLHGLDAAEQRHSPLRQINRGNVAQLGLAWSYDVGSRRGLEATPIVVDGVMYATSTWSEVFALDAATGRERWRHDPRVPRAKGRDACCDVVNRGVAVHEGRVYAGTIDGRLIALEAKTGKLIWEVPTFDPRLQYTITGAPRVVKGKVIIGNGGADLGVRGFVSAYDAITGKQVWRFYTVPASKSGPHEHSELALAAKTWPSDALWESGLGGTVWDSMAYDPALDLLYVGVGNSSVWNRDKRSPGGGDNLFLASILALRPDSGKLVWHYQTTPGESWDYTANQHMVLAEVEWRGETRKVLLQAPKNGFFYVLDRETGELLSAEKYAHVSWASHVDLATGRPVENPAADWSTEPRTIAPAPPGAHGWQPMSYSPATGLAYIPTLELSHWFVPDSRFRFRRGTFNTGEDFVAPAKDFEDIAEHGVKLPCSPARLLAWDVEAQEPAWSVSLQTGVPGGVLSTAGGLVFQGSGSRELVAYHAQTGERLWAADLGVGILAPPVSYEVEGKQMIAVLTGMGGGLGGTMIPFDYLNVGRVLAFELGASLPLPVMQRRPPRSLQLPEIATTEKMVERGRAVYAADCMRCHGLGAVSAGLYPDLRFASSKVHETWDAIVLGGVRAADGMASFADLLSVDDSRAVQAYVVERARRPASWRAQALSWAIELGLCIPVDYTTD